MLVATATRESIPNWNIAGTVMIEVLPVITLTPLVAKKMAMSASKRAPGIASIPAFAVVVASEYYQCMTSETKRSLWFIGIFALAALVYAALDGHELLYLCTQSHTCTGF